MKVVNYLDVTFNLNNNTFQPYHTSDSTLNYIHANSNHPPSILKQLPISIGHWLSSNSSSEKIFQKTAPIYNDALEKSGFHTILQYHSNLNSSITNKRKRNIIWFNPPYSKNVITKIGHLFLNLIDLHFPLHHKLHKIFNRNTIKISYSCMPNIRLIINSHNQQILRNKLTDNDIN